MDIIKIDEDRFKVKETREVTYSISGLKQRKDFLTQQERGRKEEFNRVTIEIENELLKIDNLLKEDKDAR